VPAPAGERSDRRDERALDGARGTLEDDLVAERLGEERGVEEPRHALRVRAAEHAEPPDGADHRDERPGRRHGDPRAQPAVAGVPPVVHDPLRHGHRLAGGSSPRSSPRR
jgi:hypothetical protein